MNNSAQSDERVPLSIIIPVLNEEKIIEACLLELQSLRDQGVEVIVADGGSQDNTSELATSYVDQLIKSESGRGTQMNAGAAVAQGEYLLFLHADTALPKDFSPDTLFQAQWGFFPVKLGGQSCSGQSWIFRVIESAMNLRSKVTKIATGDQALFVRSSCFQRIGGFADIPLMEDVDITRRLKVAANPLVMPNSVITSSRRWEQQGVLKTILHMWRLRLAFFFGVSPNKLAQQYDM